MLDSAGGVHREAVAVVRESFTKTSCPMLCWNANIRNPDATSEEHRHCPSLHIIKLVILRLDLSFAFSRLCYFRISEQVLVSGLEALHEKR